MRIQHLDVIHPALMPYISYYYLLSTDGDVAASTYQAFPSPNNPVGFFYDCAICLLPQKAVVTKATGQGIQEVIVGNAVSPVQVVLQSVSALPDFKQSSLIWPAVSRKSQYSGGVAFALCTPLPHNLFSLQSLLQSY